jgi:hypothetical protein
VRRWTPYAAAVAVGWVMAVAGVLSGVLSASMSGTVAQTIGGVGYTLAGVVGVLLGLYARSGGDGR